MALRELIVSILWEGASARVAKENPYVIAITGGVGKTVTKEAIAAVLETSGKPVFKSPGNLNTEFGVPLALLGYRETPSGVFGWLGAMWRAFFPPTTPNLKKGERPYYVLEYGADHPGDIPFLCSKIPPNVSVLTAIVPAHFGAYPSMKELIAEKSTLVRKMAEGGYAVLNADDPNQAELASFPSAWYGLKEKKSGVQGVFGETILREEDGRLTVTLQYQTSKKLDMIGAQPGQRLVAKTQFSGKHHLYALLAAAMVGVKEGIPLSHLLPALESQGPLAGRGRILPGKRDITIIDDSYNAPPPAVLAALASLPEIAGKRRRVAILGTMNELGDQAEQFHLDVAKAAAPAADALVFVGQYAAAQRQAAIEAGMEASRITTFLTPENALEGIEQIVKRGDVVLVKASQNGMRFERIVKRLMLEPERAGELLVRQDAHWNH